MAALRETTSFVSTDAAFHQALTLEDPELVTVAIENLGDDPIYGFWLTEDDFHAMTTDGVDDAMLARIRDQRICENECAVAEVDVEFPAGKSYVCLELDCESRPEATRTEFRLVIRQTSGESGKAMPRSVKIRQVFTPGGDLSEFDPGAHLAEMEFYKTDEPITEEERDGLAQLVHFLAFLALNNQSTAWASSVIPRSSSAFAAIESHFSHLAQCESVLTDEGVPYRALVSFLMGPYPPRRKST